MSLHGEWAGVIWIMDDSDYLVPSSELRVASYIGHHVPPFIRYHHSSGTTIHHVPPFIRYHHSSDTIIHQVPPFIRYHHSSRTTIHHVPPFIRYHHSSGTTIHQVPSFIRYHHSSRTTIHHVLLFNVLVPHTLFIGSNYLILILFQCKI